MEKGEIAQNEQFQLFPPCFPKAFFFNVLKQVCMEERVKFVPVLSAARQVPHPLALKLYRLSVTVYLL